VLPAAAPPGLVFTVADRSAVEHGGAEGVLGGVAGVVAPVLGGALEAAEDAEDDAVAGVDAWPPAAFPLVVDPQAAARAPVDSRTAAVLIRRAAWADDVMGGFPCRGGAASRTPGVS
jgi:hypothetical protein